MTIMTSEFAETLKDRLQPI